MEETSEKCKFCDHCHQPFVVTNTRIVCSLCKATFCTSKCKKNAKKDHKKCIGRPNYSPPENREEVPLPDSMVIEDEYIRHALFGKHNEYRCGYYDENKILQPATTVERATEIVASHYQQFRHTYIKLVPTEPELRRTGILRVNFDSFNDLASSILEPDIKNDTYWMLMSEEMIEKTAEMNLGEEYFCLAFTVGPKDGPYIMNATIRFLYNGVMDV
jgi:hypothetical protein